MTDANKTQEGIAKAMSFHVAEFEALRAQIRDNIASLRFIRNALLVVPGVVYGAMLANIGALGVAMAAALAWVPVFLHVVIMSFWNAEAAGIGRIAGYVREIEKTYAYAGLKGWETFAAEQRKGGPRFTRLLQVPWWMLLIAMTALAVSLTAAAIAGPVFGIEGLGDLERLLSGSE
jgi:hypothetical protein